MKFLLLAIAAAALFNAFTHAGPVSSHDLSAAAVTDLKRL